jgi:hypothetical protein
VALCLFVLQGDHAREALPYRGLPQNWRLGLAGCVGVVCSRHSHAATLDGRAACRVQRRSYSRLAFSITAKIISG